MPNEPLVATASLAAASTRLLCHHARPRRRTASVRPAAPHAQRTAAAVPRAHRRRGRHHRRALAALYRGVGPRYWLGVAGGTGMLMLFLYPLRKRWRAMREIGSTRFWFALHMTWASSVRCSSSSIRRSPSARSMRSSPSPRWRGGGKRHRRALPLRPYPPQPLWSPRDAGGASRAGGMDSAAARSKLAFVPVVEERLTEFARRADAAGQAGLGTRCCS